MNSNYSLADPYFISLVILGGNKNIAICIFVFWDGLNLRLGGRVWKPLYCAWWRVWYNTIHLSIHHQKYCWVLTMDVKIEPAGWQTSQMDKLCCVKRWKKPYLVLWELVSKGQRELPWGSSDGAERSEGKWRVAGRAEGTARARLLRPTSHRASDQSGERKGMM